MLVGDLQRHRANMVHINLEKEIYYEGLAHAIMEAEKICHLQAGGPGKLMV
jgi:hypothetical protein